ncbi:5-oxoprolinase subunit B family protein [Kytococcus sp. Marseille-QA3725]
MRLLPSGTRALLLELDDLDTVRAWHTELARRARSGALTGVADVVPAARTVLVVAQHEEALPGLRTAVQGLLEAGAPAGASGANGTTATGAGAGAGAGTRGTTGAGTTTSAGTDDGVVTVPVVYDGEDLTDAAAALGIEPDELVRRHTSEEWTVAFAGFAPGFGYCVGREFAWDVPRRAEPRTRVPSGSVALAGEFTAVYPQDSPGGWQLIGRTDMTLFDPAATPPAPMRAGVRVRFEEVAR